MVSTETWYTTAEAMEAIFLNSDSEREENSSNSDSESSGSDDDVASELVMKQNLLKAGLKGKWNCQLMKKICRKGKRTG